MAVNFSKKTILGIVLQVRKFKTLYVATDGSMFKSQASAESTLRTKNTIIGDPTKYLGYIKLEAEQLSNDNLKVYASNTKLFDALFKDATVPAMRTVEAPKGRKHAEKAVFNTEEVSEIEALLGLSAASEESEGPKEE